MICGGNGVFDILGTEGSKVGVVLLLLIVFDLPDVSVEEDTEIPAICGSVSDRWLAGR